MSCVTGVRLYVCLHTCVVAFTGMHIPVVMGRHAKTELERVFVIEAVSPTGREKS